MLYNVLNTQNTDMSLCFVQNAMLTTAKSAVATIRAGVTTVRTDTLSIRHMSAKVRHFYSFTVNF